MSTSALRTNQIQVPWNERKEKMEIQRNEDDVGNKESEFDQKSWQLREDNPDDNDEIYLDDQEDEDVF